MQGIEQLKTHLDSPKRIVITTHTKPDGDAMGSSLGLYNLLIKKGHDVTVVAPTDYAYFLNFLPGNDSVVVFESDIEKSTKLIEEAELIFCLDFNRLHRINEMGPLVEAAKAELVVVDHHLDPDDFAAYGLIDSSASSTAELIYDLILILGEEQLLDKDISTCLYTGIMTDTGSFRFPSTSAKVHHIIADLIDHGASNSEIHETVYDTWSEDRLRFFGYCLTEKLKLIPEYRTGIIAVTKEELNRFKVRTGDTEGLVNYPLSIEGISVSALIIDRSKVIKLSVRSQGDVAVNELMNEHFSGGGHRNAAGGIDHDSLEKTVQRFVELLPELARKNGLTSD
jgi:phosphoesterase RecJ-like protein